jgi:hypothetical protein
VPVAVACRFALALPQRRRYESGLSRPSQVVEGVMYLLPRSWRERVNSGLLLGAMWLLSLLRPLPHTPAHLEIRLRPVKGVS